MKDLIVPISKSDVQYDAGRNEVTLGREKFDELLRFVADVVEQLEDADQNVALSRSRLRESRADAGLLQSYVGILKDAQKQVATWVEENSVQELARRSGIPYATCHRIVNTQLDQGKVDPQKLEKILGAIQDRDKYKVSPPAARAQ